MKSYLLRHRLFLAAAFVLISAGMMLVLSPSPTRYLRLAGTILVVAGVAAIVWSVLLANRRKRQLFLSRADLGATEIYDLHFHRSGLPAALVLELWHEVANVFNLPAGKLRPTDRFGEELGNYGITGEDLYELAGHAILRARLHGGEVDLRRIKTVDCYVRAMAALQLNAAPGFRRD
jgi:uncharacterized protein YjeT (DUF2065 family)